MLLICFERDHQKLNLDETNLETRTAMKDVIYHEKYLGFWWDPQQVSSGFVLKNTL
jgi:hypothetical protein